MPIAELRPHLRSWITALAISASVFVGAQTPTVAEIRTEQKRSFEKVRTLRAIIDRTFKDESAPWVKVDQQRREESLGEAHAPSKSVTLYEAKGLAWRTSEAYVTQKGTQGFTALLPKVSRDLRKEIAKPRSNQEEVWLQVTDFDGKGRYYSRYLSADGKTPKSSVLFMRRGLMDRGPLAFGYLVAERPLYEMLEDGPVEAFKEKGRQRYRVRMRAPDGAEGLKEAFVTLDPGWGMVAVRMDVQSEWNGMLMVERFEGHDFRRIGGVWLPSEGSWVSRAFRDQKIVTGKTERSRFLDLEVNDPSVDLSHRIPQGELVTNKDSGQIFQVAADGSLISRGWTKKRPTWVATASGASYLLGVGLFGVVTCLGIARFSRRRS